MCTLSFHKHVMASFSVHVLYYFFYTGDSRAAFNILSLHQNRYLIYCCKDSFKFPPTVAS